MDVKRDYHRHSRRVTSSARWKLLRHAILERDGWACVDCGQTRGRLEIDHIKPVRDRPDLAFEPANCACRCSSCHSSKTRSEVGWAPVFDTPEHRAWGDAVAALATSPATEE